MRRPWLYTLILIDEKGEESLGGLYQDPVTATEYGQASGKRFEVRSGRL